MKDEELAEEYKCKHWSDNVIEMNNQYSFQQVKGAPHFYGNAIKQAFLAGLKACRQEEQLTKAKEIIREIMKYEIPTLDYEKAEQFLREIDIDNAIQKADEEKDAWQKYYDFGR